MAAQLTVTSGKRGARAGRVHQPRDDFLADTTFPGDENLRVGTCGGPHILAEPLHGDTLTNQFEGFVHIR